MTDSLTKPKSHNFLRATPNGEFYIIYVDENDQSGYRPYSKNMTRTELIDFCNEQWPGVYSEADIDARIRQALERLG